MINAIKELINQFTIHFPYEAAFIATFLKVGIGAVIGLCFEKYMQHRKEVEPFRGLSDPYDRDKKRVELLTGSMETLRPKNTWIFRRTDDNTKTYYSFYRDTTMEFINDNHGNGVIITNNVENKEEN
ncbi:hypothetical protein [Pseudobutyrivibrio sp.]